jgi:hypothetical protein
MALPELKMEVGNSHAIAGRADLPKDIATLYLLALLDVGRVQMAVASPPRCLINWVLHHDAVSTTPVHEDAHDGAVCRSDHRIAQGGVEVDALMRDRADPSPDASPIAVIRENPGGALGRAPSKSECCGDKNESPSPGVSARVVPRKLQIIALASHADGDPSDPGPGVEPSPQRPECTFVVRAREPGEAEYCSQESAASVEHA